MVSNRNIQVQFSGVLDTSIIQAALENPISVGKQYIIDLVDGDNTISVPVLTGLICTAVTIIPPSGNTIAMILKGDTGDVGINMNLVDPTSLAIADDVTEIIITLDSDGETITGVIIIFS